MCKRSVLTETEAGTVSEVLDDDWIVPKDLQRIDGKAHSTHLSLKGKCASYFVRDPKTFFRFAFRSQSSCRMFEVQSVGLLLDM